MSPRVMYEAKGPAGEYSPLAANLFTGCAGRCAYCYRAGDRFVDREAFHSEICARKEILKNLEHDAEQLAGDQRPVMLCFTCDPWPAGEQLREITLQAIDILHRWGLRVIVLTKQSGVNRLIARLRPEDTLGASLTLWDDFESGGWEPGCATPAERIDNLYRAHMADIRTFASLEPVIDPGQTLRLIRCVSSYTDRIAVGKFNHAGRCNWPSEEWRRRVESIDWTDCARRVTDLGRELGRNIELKYDLRRAAGLEVRG